MFDTITEILNDNHKSEIKKISDFIYDNPELCLKEKKACACQVKALKKWGFQLENPIAGLPTAYKASYGIGKPTICFMSEYDALPELGHACGHNLIAAATLTAGLATKMIMKKKKIPGSIIIMGTPGEEGKAGKQIMLQEKAFDGIDIVLTSHPFDKTSTDSGWLSAYIYKVSFCGKSSHASTAPECGINALDAVNLLFSGVNAWRQQLPESARIHGVIDKGGISSNVIPDYSECTFSIRADNEKLANEIDERFKRIVSGAAMMTDTIYDITLAAPKYRSSIINKPLNDEFFKLASDISMNPEYVNHCGRGSSDFGNVSQIIPSSSFVFGITKQTCSLHSIEFKKAAGSLYAFEQAYKIGKIMSAIALRSLIDENYKNKIIKDFKSS